MSVQNFEVIQEIAHEEVFTFVNLDADDKLQLVVESAGGVNCVKRNAANGGSDDEIELALSIPGGTATVKFNEKDTANMNADLDATFKLFMWNTVTSLWEEVFSGAITVDPPEGGAEDNVVFEYGNIGKTVSEVADVNALTVKPNYDLIQAGAAKRVYRKNAEGEYQEVSSTPWLKNILNALIVLDDGNFFLAGINLANADLQSANLSGGAFQAANFTGANLTDADLSNALLDSANFTNANLTSVNFENADIATANFTGANLTDAALPENADGKAEFKAVVGEGNWDAVTTIWTDGNPIGA
ncbi:MAG: pentapeptide repeat-containing protein [Ignavibacteriaceae bacterium]